MGNRRILIQFSCALSLAFVLAFPLHGQTDDSEGHVKQMFAEARSGSSRLVKSAEVVIADGRAATAFLLEDLSSRVPVEIVWALKCFRGYKEDACESQVFQLLEHEADEVRVEALLTAQALFGKRLSGMLFKLAQDKALSVRRRVLDAAIELVPEDPRMVGLAFDSIADGDFWLLARSFRILSRIKVEETMRAEIVERSKSIVASLRKDSARMLFSFLTKSLSKGMEPVLEHALDKGRTDARSEAFMAAERLRLKSFAPQARKALKSSNSNLCISAIRYLGAVKDKDSATLLIPMIDELSPGAKRTQVVVALRRISGQTIGFDTAQWRRWLHDTVR